MSEIKAVLFDWAGVMAPDTREPQEWLINELVDAGVDEQIASQGVNELVMSFMKGSYSEEEFWRRYAKLTHSGEFRNLHDVWELWKGGEPDEKMLDLVENVRSIGMRAVVFSNVLPPCKSIIEKNRGYDVFDGRVLSCDWGYSKPDARLYSVALAVSSCLPRSCLFIDDVEPNLMPAKELGMQTMIATNTSQTEVDLKRLLEERAFMEVVPARVNC